MHTSITYLGRVTDEEGIRLEPGTIKAKNWKDRRNKKEMRSFLGFANYYRKFIRGHSDIVHPMQLMIKKGNDFILTEERCEAFEEMKSILSSSPMIELPVDDGRFMVDTDVSAVALAGILYQEQGRS